MTPKTALIVEDEAPALANLREYLSAASWLRVVGEARDGREALRLAATLTPDVLFLDVQLPELSGLEVARRLAAEVEIVFTTAFDRFAIAAFEIGAIDYLVKPFGRDRFAVTLSRLEERLASDDAPSSRRAAEILAEPPVARLYARKGDHIIPIAVDTIRQIQARGDYAEIVTASGAYLMHVALAELSERLDPRTFARVHRSHIVNLDAVERVETLDDSRLRLVLKGGASVTASRSASETLRTLMR